MSLKVGPSADLIVGGVIMVWKPLLEDNQRELACFGQRRLLNLPQLWSDVVTGVSLGVFPLRNSCFVVDTIDACTTLVRE